MRRLNILFIHQNFPGQYKHLAPALAKEGHQVVALGTKPRQVEGVKVIPYKYLRSQTPGIHPLAQEHEVKVIRGEAVAHVCRELKRQGFTPDVIYVHPGWGEALFLREVYPSSKIIVYCEYYYNLEGQDVNFDPEFPPLTFEEECRLRMKNTCSLHAFEIGDAFIAPSKWQKSTYPKRMQSKIKVIHDGIDIDSLQNQGADTRAQAQAITGIPDGHRYITFVARGLEPIRGFHHFMRALPELQSAFPDLHAVIIGADQASYGPEPKEGGSWRKRILVLRQM